MKDGCEVVGIDCFNRHYARREKLRNLERARSWDNFDFVPVDLAGGDLYEFEAESDVIFHLAAEPGPVESGRRFDTYVRTNVLATQRVLDAARGFPSKRLVYASSSSIYGQAEQFPTPEDVVPVPGSAYGVTKLTAEVVALGLVVQAVAGLLDRLDHADEWTWAYLVVARAAT
jgi:UDP-glucuronate 4-epimerase